MQSRQNLIDQINNFQRQVENLQERESFITSVYNSIPYPLYVIDAGDLTVKAINISANNGELLENTKCYSYIRNRETPCGDEEYPCLIEQVKKERRAIVNQQIIYLEDENPVYLDYQGFPIYSSEGDVVYMVETIINISPRKRAEAQAAEYQKELRSLASQLSLAEERERRRIATEVHDRLSQTMVACSLKLSELHEEADSARFKGEINKLISLTKQMINDTRTLTFELSSPLLYELGLDAALEQLTEQMEERCDIRFHFTCDNKLSSLNLDISVLIFHAVRELLVNAMKHSQANNVSVHLGEKESQLFVVVEDNGIGFDSAQLTSKRKKIKGFGLFSIRERLRFVGGNFEVESGSWGGTRVTLSVPLNQT